MAHWEYRVLSSGKMGLGSMSVLETYLNDLGQQQWEIINWQTEPESPLKFTGLARRPILRDWAPDEMPAANNEAAIAAAKAEDEKERQAWVETLAREREFYTSVIEAEGPQDHDVDEERDLVGDLFETLRPLMKRNKRGPGTSGNVAFLAKRLDKSEDDLIGAMEEAGLDLADDANDSEAHQHGDDMYWLNRNSRGEIWLNNMPKSRYRPPQSKKAPDETKAEEPENSGETKSVIEAKDKRGPAKLGEPLPEGEALMEKLRPLMRRNRGNRGLSGSLTFLSRAVRHSEEDLTKALEAAGLTLPEDPKAEPVPVNIGDGDFWLNKNEKGQVWINARKHVDGSEESAAEGESADGAGDESPETAPDAGPPRVAVGNIDGTNVLAQARPHLSRVGRTLSHVAKASDVAGGMGISQASLLDALVAAGLEVPVEAADTPVVVDGEDDQFWLSRGEEDELLLNAKTVRKSRASKKD